MITRVTNRTEVENVARLAREIWQQHFIPIIGADQTEYMLEKFQSPSSIMSQLESGVEYYITQINDQPLGYLAIIPDQSNSQMMISKIYVLSDARSTGFGTKFLHFVEAECSDMGIEKVWLTVNRFNHGPVAWYRRNGFKIVNEVKKDIGCGYYMDDFILEKKLKK